MVFLKTRKGLINLQKIRRIDREIGQVLLFEEEDKIVVCETYNTLEEAEKRKTYIEGQLKNRGLLI